MNRNTPGLPVHHRLPKSTQTHNVHNVHYSPPMSLELVMPSNHLILCHPLLLLPSIFPSIRVFSNESVLRIMWPKYWSFRSTSVLPMNTQDWSPLRWTGWISLQSKGLSRVFSNTTVQEHQVFWHSGFFIFQLSHPYMTTGKTIGKSLDSMDLCWQSNVSSFDYAV